MKEKSFTIKEIAEMTGSRIIGNPDHIILGVADLTHATSDQLAFLSNQRYYQDMLKSKAGVILVDKEESAPAEKNFLITEDPSMAFQKVVEAFYQHRMKEKTGFKGIHSTAVIHETAKIGSNVTVGPHAVIDKDAVIGDGTTIGAGTYIGLGCKVGAECTLYQNIVIREYCILGDRVILQPGVVIGACGFGYITDKKGKHIKLNQLGIVIIEDDVEIGANTTIDRARYQTTHIHKGTKVDNLVQIAHGVSLGEDNIIVAQTGIAGSTSTGHHVIIGGQAALDGHLSITDGVMLAARSGVSKSLRKAGKYGGSPCFNLEDYNRNNVHLRNIEKYIDQIKDLESRLAALEKK